MITVNEQSYNIIQFPAGETLLRLDSPVSTPAVVEWKYDGDYEFFELELLVNALRNIGVRDIELICMYFPHARQDRITQVGESFSLKVAASIINRLDFSRVTVMDPHSDVLRALVDNIYELDRHYIMATFPSVRNLISESRSPVIVSPDAGAQKTNNSLAVKWQLPHICASKVRDTSTGAISGVSVPEVDGMDCIIVDDICDGGRTFIELGKELRRKGASSVFLFVSHGIFSKGISVFDGIIDGIFVGNLMDEDLEGEVETWKML